LADYTPTVNPRGGRINAKYVLSALKSVIKGAIPRRHRMTPQNRVWGLETFGRLNGARKKKHAIRQPGNLSSQLSRGLPRSVHHETRKRPVQEETIRHQRRAPGGKN